MRCFSIHVLHFLMMPKLCYHQNMQRPHIADILAFTLYAAALLLSLRLLLAGSDTLYVEADGAEYAYSLSRDGIYSFSGPLGTTEIEIRDGRARVVSSPCPNGTCMKAGWSDVLCCLPNRVIATTGRNGGEVNAVTG